MGLHVIDEADCWAHELRGAYHQNHCHCWFLQHTAQTGPVSVLCQQQNVTAYAVYYVISQKYAEPDCQAAHLHNISKKCALYAPNCCWVILQGGCAQ